MSETWGISLSSELGRLSQGIGDVQGNDVLDFIAFDKAPSHKSLHIQIWYVIIDR